jgi:hypothetical protein
MLPHVLQKQILCSPAELRFAQSEAPSIPGKVVATIHGPAGKSSVRLSQMQTNRGLGIIRNAALGANKYNSAVLIQVASGPGESGKV